MSNPDPALQRCTEELDNSRIAVRANGQSATFLNPDRAKIRRVDMDCWLGSTASARADYVLCKAGVVDVIVELKGKDIEHAVEQILVTHAKWKKVDFCAAKIGALVVFTRSPLRSAMLNNRKLQLYSKHKIWLEMGKTGLKDYAFETFAGERR